MLPAHAAFTEIVTGVDDNALAEDGGRNGYRPAKASLGVFLRGSCLRQNRVVCCR